MYSTLNSFGDIEINCSSTHALVDRYKDEIKEYSDPFLPASPLI